MAGLVNELISAIEKQLGFYEDLLGLSLEKKTVIIENDTKTLEKITYLETIICNKIQKLDHTRLVLMRDIRSVLNVTDPTFTIAQLIEKLEGQKEQEDLKKLSERVEKTLHELKAVNDHNQVLINNSLTYIDYSMNLIRGAVEKSGAEGFFDTKR